MNPHYTLRCMGTGTTLSDDSMPLSNPASPSPALLRAEYDDKSFHAGSVDEGLFRFSHWLPVRRTLEGSSAPVTYRSIGLAEALGLKRLFITFSGYWPERGCAMVTGTFKECEAFSVCARLPAEFRSTLVVASAGNTARAFIRVCSQNEIPLVVVVPRRNVGSVWSVGPIAPCVRVVVAGGGADYADAIALADTITGLPGYVAEGGARNVARRDGMGCTVLSAVEVIGEIPDHYFQAVGSGTGAIAAWEANLRLIQSNGFGKRKMRLWVSQNAPFQPIHESWRRRTRELVAIDEAKARRQIARIGAKVLANRKPPYSIAGGLFDALSDTDGRTAAHTNGAAKAAARLFRRLEGVDVTPAAAVAVADLVRATRSGQLGTSDLVMLNVTGGGVRRVNAELDVRPVVPRAVIDPGLKQPEKLLDLIGPIAQTM